MESNEDSIKMLEMRIRQQINDSLQRNLKPENIKYYMPSAVFPKADIQQAQQSADAAGDANPSGDGPESDSAADGPKIGMPLSDVSAPALQAADVNLPVGAEYIDRAAGTMPMREYENIKIPELKEVQHAKAMTGYEAFRSLDRKGSFNMEDMHFLDAKG